MPPSLPPPPDSLCEVKRWLTDLEKLSDERDKRYDQRYEAQTESQKIALAALDKRLDSMNEFRQQLRDQGNTFFTRLEHDAYMRAVEVDLRELRKSKDILEGKATQASVNVAYLIAGLSLAISIVKIVIDVISSK